MLVYQRVNPPNHTLILGNRCSKAMAGFGVVPKCSDNTKRVPVGIYLRQEMKFKWQPMWNL